MLHWTGLRPVCKLNWADYNIWYRFEAHPMSLVCHQNLQLIVHMSPEFRLGLNGVWNQRCIGMWHLQELIDDNGNMK
jgi:hypothetical protein